MIGANAISPHFISVTVPSCGEDLEKTMLRILKIIEILNTTEIYSTIFPETKKISGSSQSLKIKPVSINIARPHLNESSHLIISRNRKKQKGTKTKSRRGSIFLKPENENPISQVSVKTVMIVTAKALTLSNSSFFEKLEKREITEFRSKKRIYNKQKIPILIKSDKAGNLKVEE